MAQAKRQKTILPNFRAALRPHVRNMAPATMSRWRNTPPPAIVWLVQHPDVLAALLEDAKRLAQGDPQHVTELSSPSQGLSSY